MQLLPNNVALQPRVNRHEVSVNVGGVGSKSWGYARCLWIIM